MDNSLYIYKIVVTDVYDGDTITADIDLGFNMVMKNQKIRLHGINAVELRGETKQLGTVARDYVRNLILGKTVVMKSIKDKSEKYGRILGIIYTSDQIHDQSISVNEMLVLYKMAKPI